MKVILSGLFFFGVAGVLSPGVWRGFWELRKDARLLSRVLSFVLIGLWILLIVIGISILAGVIKIK